MLFGSCLRCVYTTIDHKSPTAGSTFKIIGWLRFPPLTLTEIPDTGPPG